MILMTFRCDSYCGYRGGSTIEVTLTSAAILTTQTEITIAGASAKLEFVRMAENNTADVLWK